MTGSKGLVLFGSTGSIGTQMLDVVRAQPERYHIVGLTAHTNDELLAEQAVAFRPRFVAMSDDAARERLMIRLERHDLRIPVASDEDLPSILSRVALDMPVVAAASTDLAQVVYDLLRLGLPMAIASKELLITLGDLLEPFRAQLLSLIHISEPTRLGMISYAVFCLKKKKTDVMKSKIKVDKYRSS